MNQRPYITYPATGKPENVPGASSKTLVSEPGKVSYGILDFPPHFVRSLHRHNTWELIIIDSSSAGPGYVFFDRRWWRAEPGSGVFVPKNYPHAWSSGSKTFKMLWVYGGTREEAGRVLDVPEGQFKAVTEDEEKNAPTWTTEKAG
jgi:hypothetical protein